MGRSCKKLVRKLLQEEGIAFLEVVRATRKGETGSFLISVPDEITFKYLKKISEAFKTEDVEVSVYINWESPDIEIEVRNATFRV